MVQLRIHVEPPLRKACLVAPESPLRAFYVLWLEDCGESWRICKESGGGGLAKDRRVREFASLKEAEREFDRKGATKTYPRRKGRKYRAVDVPGAELEGKEP